MKFPSKEKTESYRRRYPAGCRVELVSMDDPKAPPIGTRGTVRGVDDAGNILIDWDNGSSLNAIIGVDIIRKIDTITTICYGEKQVWDSRQEAADYFLQAIAGSEGSECERYANIYSQLISGKNTCSDLED